MEEEPVPEERYANDLDSFIPLAEHQVYWNITEDWGIDHHETFEGGTPVELTSSDHADQRVPLLFSPLPTNLPNINKDLLILEAA